MLSPAEDTPDDAVERIQSVIDGVARRRSNGAVAERPPATGLPEGVARREETARGEETPVGDAPDHSGQDVEPTAIEVDRPIGPPLFEDGKFDGAEVVDLVPSFAPPPPRQPRPVSTAMLDDLPLPVLVQNATGLLHANAPFLKLTGYSSLDALRSAGGIGALFAGGLLPGSADDDETAMRLSRADGGHRYVNAAMQSVPWRDGRGDGTALLLTLRSTDEAGKSKPGIFDPSVPQAVEDRLQSLNEVLDEATDGIVFLDEERRIRSLSRSAEALLGYGDDDVRGRAFAMLFAPEAQNAATQLVNSMGGEGPRRRSGIELNGLAADNREVPLFVTVGAMRDDGGFCAVLRDISDWREREDTLRSAADAADESSRRKSRFLARVSHEIRTPLNAIIGFAEVMAEERLGPVGNPKYREYLADIRSSGRHVLDLVNDLLDIARIESGREDLRFDAVEITDVLREATTLVQTQATDARILVRSSIEDVPPVVADRRSIKQVVVNVLTNAVNYTEPGGQVIVSCKALDGGVMVRIRDTGVGMDQDDIARALEPFGEPDTRIGEARKSGGIGLGLPLSRALAEANRARFSISSVRGRGTLVELYFPRERVLD